VNPRIARCLAASATLVSLAVVGHAQAFPQTPSKPGGATPTDIVPQPLVGIGIEEHPGAQIPKGLTFRDQDGKTVTLDDYFKDGKPVVLDLAYYDCPMLCSIVLNGLKDGLKQLAWQPGKEFHVVVASIDPRDDEAKAQKKRKSYLDAFGKPVGEKGWDFLVGPKPTGKVDSPFDPEEIRSDDLHARELAKTIGFSYRWDDKTNQYAHAAGIFVFTPDGRLSRVLYGIQYSERDLRLALSEASAGKLGTTWDRVLLLCYHYDPNEHSYVLAGKRMMSAGGALTALLLGTFLVRLWRKEMQRHPETPS
jgi:protein SCO1/2